VEEVVVPAKEDKEKGFAFQRKMRQVIGTRTFSNIVMALIIGNTVRCCCEAFCSFFAAWSRCKVEHKQTNKQTNKQSIKQSIKHTGGENL
jgi:hypothetical protein